MAPNIPWRRAARIRRGDQAYKPPADSAAGAFFVAGCRCGVAGGDTDARGKPMDQRIEFFLTLSPWLLAYPANREGHHTLDVLGSRARGRRAGRGPGGGAARPRQVRGDLPAAGAEEAHEGPSAAHACRALCRARAAEELQRRRGTRIGEHLKLVLKHHRPTRALSLAERRFSELMELFTSGSYTDP